MLDGGACRVGLESTVLDVTGDRAVLLRPGAVTREMIEKVAGPLAAREEHGTISAPGMLASHYAPALPLRTEAREVAADEALLAFGPEPLPDSLQGAAKTLNLSAQGDLTEAAANLFAMLRALDDPAFRGIAAMAVPRDGLGAAINDRLARAAAPRPSGVAADKAKA